MRNLILGAAVAAALALVAGTAQADTIDFEGFGGNTIFGDENLGNGLEVGTSNGFDFTSSGDHFHFGSSLSGVPSNGTSIMLQDRDYEITMVHGGGAAFDLLSGDFGEDDSFSNSATAIRVTGFFSGGGSIATTIALDGVGATFQNETFVGFTGLSSVVFDGVGGASGNSYNGFTFDNLEANVVPEPASLTLLALGGMGLLGVRRRAARKVS